MTAKKSIRLVLGLTMAGLFLWLMLRQISLPDVKRAFEGTDPAWLIAALAAFVAGYASRIERWRLMLERDSTGLKWSSCAGPLFASFAINNVLPFRAGDVLRSFAFNRNLGVSSGVVIATLFVERLLDLLMVLLVLGIALALLGVDTARFVGIGSSALLAIAAAVSFVLLFPRLFAPMLLTLGRLASRLAPLIGQRILEEVQKSLTTLQHLARGNTMIKLISWSLLAWIAEGCVFWFAALSLPSVSAPEGSWLALPVGTLATLIPSTPGYVGTFDYFTVRAMTALGNAVTSATAYALLVHALLWLPPTLIGGIFLLLHPAKQTVKLQTT
jgi:glycosyltransferase 2 family protein